MAGLDALRISDRWRQDGPLVLDCRSFGIVVDEIVFGSPGIAAVSKVCAGLIESGSGSAACACGELAANRPSDKVPPVFNPALDLTSTGGSSRRGRAASMTVSVGISARTLEAPFAASVPRKRHLASEAGCSAPGASLLRCSRANRRSKCRASENMTDKMATAMAIGRKWRGCLIDRTARPADPTLRRGLGQSRQTAESIARGKSSVHLLRTGLPHPNVKGNHCAVAHHRSYLS